MKRSSASPSPLGRRGYSDNPNASIAPAKPIRIGDAPRNALVREKIGGVLFCRMGTR